MQAEKMIASLAPRARALRFATQAIAGLVLLIMMLASFAALTGRTDPGLALSFALGTTNAYVRWAGLLVVLLTGLPFVWGLWQLSRMLRCAEMGEVFSRAAAGHLRAFAFWVFIAATASIVLPATMNLILGTIEGLPRERLRVDFDGSDLFILLVSGLLFFVARLIEAAQLIADDNRQIV